MLLYLLVSTIIYPTEMPEVIRMLQLHVGDRYHVGNNQQCYEYDNGAHASVSSFLERILPAHVEEVFLLFLFNLFQLILVQ